MFTYLSILKSARYYAAVFFIASRAVTKAYFPVSLVGVYTKHVYLGAPIIDILTS
jgi:hypothetical protein